MAALRIADRIDFVLATLVLAASVAGCSTPQRDGRPSATATPVSPAIVTSAPFDNLVVVLLDAGAAAHFSFLGYGRQTTPNLDAVAAQAVVFETAYAQASATLLSVYSILTSRYPLAGSIPTQNGEIVFSVPPQTPCLAQLLAPRFAARLCVSASCWSYPTIGFDRGFTSFFQVGNGNGVPTHGLRNDASKVTDCALNWIDAQRVGPFFAWLHYLEPHTPYTPPEPYASRFDPQDRGYVDGSAASVERFAHETPTRKIAANIVALYDGNLAYVDAQVGRLVAGLRERGLWDRTLFVLLADHGEAFWEHQMGGHALSVYEEFVRVPLVLRVPGVAQLAGRRVARPVELVDLLPTLLDLCKVPHDGVELAGRSLLSSICNPSETRPDIAHMRNHDIHRVQYAVREGDLKLFDPGEHSPAQLFDLSEDPGEQVNLRSHRDPAKQAASQREFEQLASELRRWLEHGIGARGAHAPAPVDTLDGATVERLRAMGYFH